MSTYITKRAAELGLRKVDAQTPLLLDVRPSDISGANTKNPELCGFARACMRSLKVRRAYFFRTTAHLEYPDRIVRYVLPPAVQKEIVSFDRNKTMEPGIYQLSAPFKSKTMEAVKARSADRPGRHQPANGNIQRKFIHRTANVRGLQPPGK